MADHLPEVRVTTLEGTYLVWLDIRSLGITSDEATEQLLKEGKVLVNSGTMYGERAGEGFIRVNIACPRQQLMLALESMCKDMKIKSYMRNKSETKIILLYLFKSRLSKNRKIQKFAYLLDTKHFICHFLSCPFQPILED
jgi:hypothetical protein